MITSTEQDSLRTQLDELLQNREVAGWFSKAWEVQTEVPILLPDGAENRVDRLLLNGRKAVIVDFKTGEPDKRDQKQVLEYIDVLRKMNFIEVEGYLLYVRTSELVAVGQRKLKVVKKKDDHQLGLGI
jgi:ATP-dependent helicase/nuclease subunit A